MSTQPVVITTPEELAEQTEAAMRAAFVDDDAYRWVLSDPRGRRVLQQQLEAGRIYLDSFSGTPMDGYFAGLRAVALALRARIKGIDPALLYLMEREYEAPPKAAPDAVAGPTR